MKNNIFIHPIGEDSDYTMPASVTYSASTINSNSYNNDSITTAGDPFMWFQPFDWSGAPQHTAYTYDLGDIDELIIRIHGEEIKIPITDDFINNLKQFLLGLAYIEE